MSFGDFLEKTKLVFETGKSDAIGPRYTLNESDCGGTIMIIILYRVI